MEADDSERAQQRRSLTFQGVPSEDPEGNAEGPSFSRRVSISAKEERRRQDEARCGLTKTQQRLAIVFSLWFMGGLYMYMARTWGSGADARHYTFIEAIYVMVQIITTVGYGDLTPTTNLGFLFTALYVITAVMVISSIVSTVTELVIRSEDVLIRSALSSVSKDISKASQRLTKAKDRVAEMVTKSTDLIASSSGRSVLAARTLEPAAKQEEEACEPAQEGEEESAAPLPVGGDFFHVSTVAFFRALGIWCLFVAAGTVFYAFYPGEDKTLAEAGYMSVITLTTVGFGDITPSTDGGMIFACFWMLLGVASFANMVAKFAAFVMAQDRLESLDRGFLLEIQEDPFYQKCHPGESRDQAKVTRADFVVFMMDQMGLLDDAVVESLSQNFDELDRDGSGYLDGSDIAAFTDKLRRTLTAKSVGPMPSTAAT